MENTKQLHRAQIAILSALRHSENLRFSSLMRPTGLESDVFKFHVRKLTKVGYIEKTNEGLYRLTPRGKEYANNLDEQKRSTQRQPKLSVLVIVPKPGEHPEPVFLFQQRRRHPYFDFWSCIGGPIQWGEDATETATREVHKQTGLKATCVVKAFYRVRDYDKSSGLLLEDKLFIVLEATEVNGTMSNTWYAGTNAWMTEREYRQQDRYFPSVCKAIAMLRTGQTYASESTYYQVEDY
jgi:ADP-ribose pyrophosphatase YjhB (NUDIX family)/predicted transcriptional regulator